MSGESEVQFHFFNEPLEFIDYEPKKENPLVIRITPKTRKKGLKEFKDWCLFHTDFSADKIYFYNNHSKIPEFNAINDRSVYSNYRFRSYENPLNLIFQMSIFELSEDRTVEKFMGSCYYNVNKSLLQNSIIETEIPLIDLNQVIGSLKLEVLIITGLNESRNARLEKNYHYDFDKGCVTVGHRGMGKTFDAGLLPDIFCVENTIDSFREAYNRGAQMVEFDVVLTKDKIPIIYHDFSFCIDHPSICEGNENKFINIPVNQLNYDEIKQNRIYSGSITKSHSKLSLNSDEYEQQDNNKKDKKDHYTSKLMFPTLAEMFKELDINLAFNVEIKYPIDLEVI
jgi:hypothetical protein